MKALLSGEEVSRIVGLSPRRVRAMLESGQIKAERVGRAYAVEPYALIGIRVFGKSGRPAPGEIGREITKEDIDKAFEAGGVLDETKAKTAEGVGHVAQAAASVAGANDGSANL